MNSLYHFHLKKCGGTSLNAWLSRQVGEGQEYQSDWLDRFKTLFLDEGDRLPPTPATLDNLRTVAKSAFQAYPIIGSHLPIFHHAPDDTFMFTILRNPIDRIVSQIADWKRLVPSDYHQFSPHVQEGYRAAAQHRILPFLEEHGTSTFRRNFDGYMVRALAAIRLGDKIHTTEDMGFLLECALEALETKFHLIGLTDRMAETQSALANKLGLLPEDAPLTLNTTSARTKIADEIAEAGPLIEQLARHEMTLYKRAEQLFEENTRPLAETYSQAVYEAMHLDQALQQLPRSVMDGEVVFSCRNAMIASGVWSRDASRTENCRLWTGPATCSVFYIPVPVDQTLSLKIWVHGYVSDDQRDHLTLEIDGQPHAHRFVAKSGWREQIVTDVHTQRPYIKLVLRVPHTLSSADVDEGTGDMRKRGVSFDNISWEPHLKGETSDA